MNKAFVREADPTDALHCPRCGSLGILVRHETLKEQLRDDARSKLGQVAYFCPFPSCEIVYFDDFDRFTLIEDSVVPPYPKDGTAPICACFGFSCDEIEADLRERGVTRTRNAVAQAKSAAADCLRKSPSGQPCVGEIQRYYMRGQQER